MYRRIFIADRGLSARYVAMRVRALGAVPVVAVSTAEREQGWLSEFESVCIGPRAAEHSYLNGLALLQGALESRCTALHPGLSPLGDHPVFAALVAARGLAFLGPSAGALERMAPAKVRYVTEACGIASAPRTALRTWFDDGPVPSLRWPVTVEMTLPLARSLSLGGRLPAEVEHHHSLYPGLRQRVQVTSEVALRQLARRAYRLGALDASWLAESDAGVEVGCIVAGDAFGAHAALPLGFVYADEALDLCSIGPCASLHPEGEVAREIAERTARVLGVQGLCLVRCVLTTGDPSSMDRASVRLEGSGPSWFDAGASPAHGGWHEAESTHGALKGRVALRSVSGLSDPAVLGLHMLAGIDLVALGISLARGVRLEEALYGGKDTHHARATLAERALARGTMALITHPPGRETQVRGPRRCVLPNRENSALDGSCAHGEGSAHRVSVQSLAYLSEAEPTREANALEESYDGRLMVVTVADKESAQASSRALAGILSEVVVANLSTNLEALRLRVQRRVQAHAIGAPAIVEGEPPLVGEARTDEESRHDLCPSQRPSAGSVE